MRYENKKHLAYVREKQCILGNTYGCGGSVEAHHLLKPFDGKRGMSLKATDRNVVPLCSKHHKFLHDQRGDEDFFWVEFGKSQDFGRSMAMYFWLTSPHYSPILAQKA